MKNFLSLNTFFGFLQENGCFERYFLKDYLQRSILFLKKLYRIKTERTNKLGYILKRLRSYHFKELLDSFWDIEDEQEGKGFFVELV